MVQWLHTKSTNRRPSDHKATKNTSTRRRQKHYRNKRKTTRSDRGRVTHEIHTEVQKVKLATLPLDGYELLPSATLASSRTVYPCFVATIRTFEADQPVQDRQSAPERTLRWLPLCTVAFSNPCCCFSQLSFSPFNVFGP